MAKSKEWHKRRRLGIGGSDAPVIIMGDSHPFTTLQELWEDKLGILPPKKETAPMKRGTALEPLVLKLYAEQTGRTTSTANINVNHPEHKFIIGNIDGWQKCEEKGDGIVEIKCPNMRTFMKCKREGPLDYYIIQVQHYLAASGAKYATIAIFNAELWELLTFDIDRDEEFIAHLIEEECKFWDLVQSKTPPTVTAKEHKMPELKDMTDMVKMDSDGWADAVETYKMAKEMREEAEEIERDARNRIANLMEVSKATLAEGGGLRAYYREQKGRVTFDHKKFAAMNPNLNLEPYYKQGSSFRTLNLFIIEEDK